MRHDVRRLKQLGLTCPKHEEDASLKHEVFLEDVVDAHSGSRDAGGDEGAALSCGVMRDVVLLHAPVE